MGQKALLKAWTHPNSAPSHTAKTEKQKQSSIQSAMGRQSALHSREQLYQHHGTVITLRKLLPTNFRIIRPTHS